MDWKIGEIREVNGEWYQCLKGIACKECDFSSNTITCDIHGAITCTRKGRSDDTSVVFKKLKKVGEPYYNSEKKLCQQYKCYIDPLVTDEIVYVFADNRAVIEIKQTKEDMEENKLNLKPFDIQKAREGKPVCTRDGRKARIICFDSTLENYPLVVLVGDHPYSYTAEEKFNKDSESSSDLMILPEKKEGWVNIVRGSDGRPHMGRGIFQSKEEAENAIKAFSDNLIDIVKISWEEQP